MLRLLFRVLATFALAITVILAVIDATRSIAASALTFTSLGESWFSMAPASLNLTQAAVQRYTLPVLWDPVAILVLGLPGWLVFAALALALHAIGRRRKPRHVLA